MHISFSIAIRCLNTDLLYKREWRIFKLRRIIKYIVIVLFICIYVLHLFYIFSSTCRVFGVHQIIISQQVVHVNKVYVTNKILNHEILNIKLAHKQHTNTMHFPVLFWWTGYIGPDYQLFLDYRPIPINCRYIGGFWIKYCVVRDDKLFFLVIYLLNLVTNIKGE